MIEQKLQPATVLDILPFEPLQTHNGAQPALTENGHRTSTENGRAELPVDAGIDLLALYTRVEYMERTAGATRTVFEYGPKQDITVRG